MLLHAAICPHALKLIADWPSGPFVACACFACEFLPSYAVLKWITRRLQALFYIVKREKVWDWGVFEVFWINLPRYVGVILYDSIYRMNLTSCEAYEWILSSSNCGTLLQAKNHKDTFCSAVLSNQNAVSVQNFPFAVLFWGSWFHRRIIHWLNASKRFIVLWLALAVNSYIEIIRK